MRSPHRNQCICHCIDGPEHQTSACRFTSASSATGPTWFAQTRAPRPPRGRAAGQAGSGAARAREVAKGRSGTGRHVQWSSGTLAAQTRQSSPARLDWHQESWPGAVAREAPTTKLTSELAIAASPQTALRSRVGCKCLEFGRRRTTLGDPALRRGRATSTAQGRSGAGCVGRRRPRDH